MNEYGYDINDVQAGMAADPRVLAQLLAASLAGPRMGGVDKDYNLGAEMFQTPGAGGRNLGYTYVASSPLEHFANALMKVQGYKRMQAAQQAREGQVQAMGTGIDRAIQLLLGRQRQPQPQPQPATGPIPSLQPVSPDEWMGVPYPYPR